MRLEEILKGKDREVSNIAIELNALTEQNNKLKALNQEIQERERQVNIQLKANEDKEKARSRRGSISQS